MPRTGTRSRWFGVELFGCCGAFVAIREENDVDESGGA
jgi:hypothetical protein